MNREEFDRQMTEFDNQRLALLNEKSQIETRLTKLRNDIDKAKHEAHLALEAGLRPTTDLSEINELERKRRSMGASCQLLQQHLAEVNTRRKLFHRQHYDSMVTEERRKQQRLENH